MKYLSIILVSLKNVSQEVDNLSLERVPGNVSYTFPEFQETNHVIGRTNRISDGLPVATSEIRDHKADYTFRFYVKYRLKRLKVYRNENQTGTTFNSDYHIFRNE